MKINVFVFLSLQTELKWIWVLSTSGIQMLWQVRGIIGRGAGTYLNILQTNHIFLKLGVAKIQKQNIFITLHSKIGHFQGFVPKYDVDKSPCPHMFQRPCYISNDVIKRLVGKFQHFIAVAYFLPKIQHSRCLFSF